MSRTHTNSPLIARLVLDAMLLVALALVGCSNNPPAPAPPSLEGMEPQVQDAVREAHEALADDTGSAEAWGRYAMTLDVHDLAEPALDAYAKACELAPGEFRWWYYRATRLARTNPGAAVPMFEKAKGFRPDYASLYVRYGRALEELGEWDEAMTVFQRGAELDPDSALAHAGIGRLQLAEGRIEEATQALERAVELDAECGVALSSLVHVYERLGESDQAQAMSARAETAPQRGAIDDPVMGELETLGVSSGHVMNRARTLSSGGASQQAVDELEALTQANPSRADAHIAKGREQLKLFRFEDAIESFRQAIAIDGGNVKAHLGLADALRFARRPAEAIEEYRFVIQRDETIGEAYRGLATALVQQNQLGGALQQFRKAVELMPDDVGTRIALGRLEYLEFNDQHAIEALAPIVEAHEPSTRTDHNTIQALLYTGLAQLRAGDEDAGSAHIEAALDAGADRPSVAQELGEIGRAAMAVAILRGAIERNPNDANAIMALAYELASTPQDEVRDPDEALRLVDSLLSRNVGGFRAHEIRAFALAEKGMFTEAVQTLEQVMSAAQGRAPGMIIKQFRERIEQFKRHEPYRHTLQLPGADR